MTKAMFRTIIEVTDSHVKILQAKVQRTGVEVVHGRIHEIRTPAMDAFRGAVSGGLSFLQKEGGPLTLIVPRRQVVLKQLRLPAHNDAEVRRMVDLQAGQDIPFAGEDAIYAYSVLEKKADGYTTVLLHAVGTDIVSGYIRVLQEFHLNCQQVLPGSYGILQQWLALAPRNQGTLAGAAVIVDVDLHHAEICFVHGTHLVFSRYVPCGLSALRGPEPEDFYRQLKLTLQFYRKEGLGAAPECLTLFAADRPDDTVLKQIEHVSGLTAEVLSSGGEPLRTVLDRDNPVYDPAVSLTAGLGVLSLALPFKINLIPPEVVLSKSSRLKRRERLRLLVVVVLLLVLFGMAVEVDNFQKRSRLFYLEKEVKDRQAAVTRVEKKIQALRSLQGKIKSRVLFVNVMAGLYQSIPEKIFLRSLSLGQDQKLVLMGFGETRSDLNRFQNNLINADRFRDVSLEYATERKRFKDEFVEFKIVCHLAGEDGADNP